MLPKNTALRLVTHSPSNPHYPTTLAFRAHTHPQRAPGTARGVRNAGRARGCSLPRTRRGPHCRGRLPLLCCIRPVLDVLLTLV